MTIPSLFIGLLISSLFGAIFHLWRGGGPGRLLLYLALAWLGFWGGHALGVRWEWSFFSLGPLRLGMATLGSIIALGIGYWLSLVDMGETK
ncbi:MAG: hypothetical protein ISS57_16400 [Anaerolineales bacterium]|nr:hypothetical protein [Anaerolineales bacterium]